MFASGNSEDHRHLSLQMAAAVRVHTKFPLLRNLCLTDETTRPKASKALNAFTTCLHVKRWTGLLLALGPRALAGPSL
jgi:hypothetical protein